MLLTELNQQHKSGLRESESTAYQVINKTEVDCGLLCYDACSLVCSCQHFGGKYLFHLQGIKFYSENGEDRFLRNVGNSSKDYMA